MTSTVSIRSTNTVTSGNVGGRNFFVAAGSGHGWTADEAKGVVYKIDDAGRVVDDLPDRNSGARVVSYSDGVVWVGNQDAGTVSAIDADSGDITTYEFEPPDPGGRRGRRHRVRPAGPGLAVRRRLSEIDGEVAKFFVGSYELDPTNPA